MRPAPVGPVFSVVEFDKPGIDLDHDDVYIISDVDSAARWLFSQTYYDTTGGEECEVQA